MIVSFDRKLQSKNHGLPERLCVIADKREVDILCRVIVGRIAKGVR